ncbi:DUF349 domain-containing protein [Alteromonas sp. ASW11-36]|uniref:DUF349 domain-containing protein n=1 Tax=Alteromonas arenosi TaxID=3055817 RepID=A0ABT7SWP9_9ALTE|nr:DUF349 domain-containing protein [Alteromonas sp. ASW11-36]MDM7860616.1 DUF349 domain-containing protein [Alteromonas sp. ASW11-36]
MIFKRLFTPKHSHKDPAIRIQAIEKLNPNVASDKSKLHELAFNDADGRVSLAALEQLKSFPLWLKMSQIAANSAVKSQAQKKVLAILSDESSDLITPELRRATVLESKEIVILKHALEHTDMFNDEPEVVSELLHRIGDNTFSRQFMLQHASENVREFLISRLDDLETLTKLNRHIELAAHQELIVQRIETLRAKALRPSELSESLRLNLSKLKALTDGQDYAAVSASSTQLRLHIEADIAELGEYDEQSAQALQQKYALISQAVDHTLARLYPQYQEQQAALAKREQLKQWRAKATELAAQAKALVGEGFEIIDDNVQLRIDGLRASIATLVNEAEPASAEDSLTQQLQVLATRLEKLPSFIAAQQQLNAIVKSFEESYQVPQSLSEYDASKTVFDTLKQQVGTVIGQVGNELPEEMQSNWLTLQQHWQKALNDCRKQADETMRLCQSKLRAAQGLYKQGKFKAVLAIDKKVITAVTQLPASFVMRIQRQLDAHQAMVAELKGWQSYVAAPRLPELLQQMQTLAAEPVRDIDERRQQVQVLRRNWNSLQIGDQQQAESLQQQFDQAAEQAFAPVQQFQAEENAMRADNKSQAESILTELEQLNPNMEDDNEFAKLFNQLNQRWFKLGEIGRADWQALKRRYTALSKPLKQRVAAVHNENAEQKRRLIKRAEALLQDSTSDVVQQVKALQKQWQAVGFAGSKQDQSLWKTFRSVNDRAFAQLKQQKQSVQATFDNALDAAESTLNGLLESIEQEGISTGQLDVLEEELDKVMRDFNSAVNDIDEKLVRRPMQQLRRLSDDISNRIRVQKRELKLALFNSQLQQLFDYLPSRVDEDELLDQHAPNLPGIALRSVAQSESLTRQAITVRIEIVTMCPSPKHDSELRSQQQVQLMSEKLSSGELPDKWQLFAQWLATGPLRRDDLSLLARVRAALMPDTVEVAKRVV